MMTNNPDQQARRPLLQPSIGYSLRQLGKTPVIPLLDRRPPLLTEEAFIVMLRLAADRCVAGSSRPVTLVVIFGSDETVTR